MLNSIRLCSWLICVSYLFLQLTWHSFFSLGISISWFLSGVPFITPSHFYQMWVAALVSVKSIFLPLTRSMHRTNCVARAQLSTVILALIICCKTYNINPKFRPLPEGGLLWFHHVFEHTCAYARWALMHRFLSVCLWLDHNSLDQNSD